MHHVCPDKHCVHAPSLQAFAFLAHLPLDHDRGAAYILRCEPYISDASVRPAGVHMGSSIPPHSRMHEAQHATGEHVCSLWDRDCHRCHARCCATVVHVENPSSASRSYWTVGYGRFRTLCYSIEHHKDASNQLYATRVGRSLHCHRRYTMGSTRTTSWYHSSMYTLPQTIRYALDRPVEWRARYFPT
jgi:hypothetical protein